MVLGGIGQRSLFQREDPTTKAEVLPLNLVHDRLSPKTDVEHLSKIGI